MALIEWIYCQSLNSLFENDAYILVYSKLDNVLNIFLLFSPISSQTHSKNYVAC